MLRNKVIWRYTSECRHLKCVINKRRLESIKTAPDMFYHFATKRSRCYVNGVTRDGYKHGLHWKLWIINLNRVALNFVVLETQNRTKITNISDFHIMSNPCNNFELCIATLTILIHAKVVVFLHISLICKSNK